MTDSVNIASILINVLLQVTLLAALLLIAIWLLRGKAVWRYQLSFTGLIAVLLLAISSVWMQTRDINPLTLQLQLPILAISQPLSSSMDAAGAPALDQFEVVPPPAANLDQLVSEMFSFFSTSDSRISGRNSFGTGISVLITLWLTVSLIGLARLVYSGFKLGQLRRLSRLPSNVALARLHQLTARLHNQLTPDFLLSERMHSPVHVGFFKPVIILPGDIIEDCDDAQLEAVITHEIAHWYRRDNVANLVQQIIVAMFWFHPLVHRLAKLASQSREEVCDNHVLAHQDPIRYSETLFWLSTRNRPRLAQWKDQRTAVAMFTQHWRLEQRIQQLLDKNRETTMQLSKRYTHTLRFSLLALTLLIASFTLVPALNTVEAQSTDDSEDRSPPQTRDAETLSEAVFESVTEIQELLTGRRPDSEDEPEPEAAKERLDALYESEFADANSFEQSTILNFYTNYYLMQQDYPEALQTFEQLLEIEGLRADTRLRTLRSLGQLYAHQERWQESLDAYSEWRRLSDEEDDLVFRGLAYNHYQLENWLDSREFWLQYMQMQSSEDMDRDDYAYLNGLHVMLEDWQSAVALTKEMILRFNEQTDWDNLRAIYAQLDDQNALAALNPDLGGTLDLAAQEPQIAFASVVPTDGDYMPLLATAPMYPRAAADQGIEGWVLVGFTVGADGQVQEDSIEIVDAEPAEVFDASSVRATREFVFAPRMVAGEAVPVPGVQYLFRFRLSDDDA